MGIVGTGIVCRSFQSEDDMIAAVSAHHLAHLPHLQLKSGILEWGLHLSPLKVAQVTSPLAAGAL